MNLKNAQNTNTKGSAMKNDKNDKLTQSPKMKEKENLVFHYNTKKVEM